MNTTIIPDSTVAEVARQLNVTTPTIYKMIHQGLLHAYKVGRATRVTRESIELLRNGGVTA